MKTSVRRAVPFLAAVLTLRPVLRAHPGHDDGHELVWDLGHLGEHPLATIGCLAVCATAGWAGWLLARRLTAPRSQTFRGSQPSRGK